MINISNIDENIVMLHFGYEKCFKTSRSSRQEVFCEKGVLRIFAKFTGKYLWHNLFYNKVAILRLATLLKKRLWHKCFPVNFAKFLRTLFCTEHLRWLHLNILATLFLEMNVWPFKIFAPKFPYSFWRWKKIKQANFVFNQNFLLNLFLFHECIAKMVKYQKQPEMYCSKSGS